MPFQPEARLAAHDYVDPYEKSAFLAGYVAGYEGKPMWADFSRAQYPNVYRVGYGEGVADSGRPAASREGVVIHFPDGSIFIKTGKGDA
ncbi:hypothetical protein ABGN05_00130 [Aquibium sp. LZ166]|uniref:Uncharacterized protein n=1 Tax=Aquibium pacificus TaxID=3153579 RepID=A0ABV3SDB9_9HYPH